MSGKLPQDVFIDGDERYIEAMRQCNKLTIIGRTTATGNQAQHLRRRDLKLGIRHHIHRFIHDPRRIFKSDELPPDEKSEHIAQLTAPKQRSRPMRFFDQCPFRHRRSSVFEIQITDDIRITTIIIDLPL